MKVDGKFREVEAAAQLAFAKIMGSAEGKTGQNAAFPAGWNDGWKMGELSPKHLRKMMFFWMIEFQFS